MAKVVTMGEILLRLSTKDYKKFIQADEFEACFGGSEANVAVSLAMLGMDSAYVTKVPDNPIGRSAVSTLRKMSVDTSHVSYGGDRLGIYYMEKGSAVRPSNVVYDRAGSSICTAESADFNFDKIFDGADWFHFSGITPAISKSAEVVVLEAVKAAKRNGLTVSCDLNFRKKLWTTEEARRVMPQYMEYVDVIMGGREDAGKMLGFALSKENKDDTPNLEAYEKMFRDMVEMYHFKYVISSLRQSHTSSYHDFSGCIYDGKNFYTAKKYEISPMVDRVGGGDAFAAGIIFAILSGKETKDVIEFAVAASALKHTIPGDANLSTVEEIEHLVKGNGIGRVQR
ncbi:MAG: sugar kinase [Eubacterium sp.]|nr:sugar kinase [Eubacterium sp.]